MVLTRFQWRYGGRQVFLCGSFSRFGAGFWGQFWIFPLYSWNYWMAGVFSPSLVRLSWLEYPMTLMEGSATVFQTICDLQLGFHQVHDWNLAFLLMFLFDFALNFTAGISRKEIMCNGDTKLWPLDWILAYIFMIAQIAAEVTRRDSSNWRSYGQCLWMVVKVQTLRLKISFWF